MPRVLIFGEFPTLNGGERSLLAVLPYLLAAGWIVDACVPPFGPFAEALQPFGIAIRPLRSIPRTLEERRAEIAALLRTECYDLLHANSLATGRWVGPVAATAGVPSLAHLRDIVKLNRQTIVDLNANTRLLAVSQAVADFHGAQGLAAEKLGVLRNGVDLHEFRPAGRRNTGTEATDIRAELRLSSDAQLIAVVGQIILRKGQDTALAAAATVLRDRPDAHLLLIGARHSEKPETRDYERRLQQIVADESPAYRVHRLGTRTDLRTLLPQTNMLLHTPRQEPLGRVLLEAAACGLPVVATEVGGTKEIFPRGPDDGALLVPVDDAAAAAAAVAQLLDDSALGERIGGAGRRRMEAAFSVERSAAGLLQQYQAAIGR